MDTGLKILPSLVGEFSWSRMHRGSRSFSNTVQHRLCSFAAGVVIPEIRPDPLPWFGAELIFCATVSGSGKFLCLSPENIGFMKVAGWGKNHPFSD